MLCFKSLFNICVLLFFFSVNAKNSVKIKNSKLNSLQLLLPASISPSLLKNSSLGYLRNGVYCGESLCSSETVSCCDYSADPCCLLPVGSGTCCPDGCYSESYDVCCNPGACPEGGYCCGLLCCINGYTCESAESSICSNGDQAGEASCNLDTDDWSFTCTIDLTVDGYGITGFGAQINRCTDPEQIDFWVNYLDSGTPGTWEDTISMSEVSFSIPVLELDEAGIDLVIDNFDFQETYMIFDLGFSIDVLGITLYEDADVYTVEVGDPNINVCDLPPAVQCPGECLSTTGTTETPGTSIGATITETQGSTIETTISAGATFCKIYTIIILFMSILLFEN